MQRRQLLAAVVAAPSLPEIDSSFDDPESDTCTRPTASTSILESVATSTLIERYDYEGSVIVRAYPHSEEPAVAALRIAADWGEASASLTAPEARALAYELLDAAEKANEWEE